MPQLRQNIVTGEWVVIAPERSKRPTDFVAAESIKPQLKAECPFCITNKAGAYDKRQKDYESDLVYVAPNKFPAFVEDVEHCSPRTFKLENNFYNARPSTGGHDIIVAKDHDHQIYDFSEDIWFEMLEMARHRYIYWRQDCNTRYSMLIYNQGVRAGASIYHPHAQLFASNIIPNQISRELDGALDYFSDNGSCVFCDLVAHEREEKTRVLIETDDLIVFTFYAARFPFETWVLPKEHLASFATVKPALIKSLATVMRKVVSQLGTTLQKPSFNLYLHDLPTGVDRADYYHWHIEIAPRVSTYGGYELGSGTIIDVMSPEDAAGYLRQNKVE